MKRRADKLHQLPLFRLDDASPAAMAHAFAKLPKPKRAAVTVISVAVTADQRAVIDRAMRAVAARSGQTFLAGIDAGSPAAHADAIVAALSEWLSAREGSIRE